MKLSTILLLIGASIAAVGAALSMANMEPYADYLLLAGAVIILIRGFIRNHERDDKCENE